MGNFIPSTTPTSLGSNGGASITVIAAMHLGISLDVGGGFRIFQGGMDFGGVIATPKIHTKGDLQRNTREILWDGLFLGYN